VTLAKDCGDVEMLLLGVVAADWTGEGGMDSRAGDVGGSMVTRYARWGWNWKTMMLVILKALL
jgi:hypothetical protein